MAAYLDNSATTAVLPQAAEAALRAMREGYGNPSSLHEMGRSAKKMLEGARAALALAFGCEEGCVYFTSGGSESINTAIMGAAFKNKHRGRHILSTAIEHDAVLNSLNELKNQGYEITLAKPERDGTIDLEKFLSLIRDDTILVTMQGINNETGAVLPYKEAAARYKEKVPFGLFHLDGVQSFLKRPMPLENVDLASVSAHKIGGLKGSGALYIRKGLTIKPLIYGGGQEKGMRSGTEGMPQIAAFAEAALYRREHMEESRLHMAEIKAAIIKGAKELGAAVNTPENSADHIVNLSMLKGRSEVYIRILSDMGVYVSGGSACARGKRSHVLAAMGLPARNIDAALRVSLCPENTMGDAQTFLKGLEQAAKMF